MEKLVREQKKSGLPRRIAPLREKNINKKGKERSPATTSIYISKQQPTIDVLYPIVRATAKIVAPFAFLQRLETCFYMDIIYIVIFSIKHKLFI